MKNLIIAVLNSLGIFKGFNERKISFSQSGEDMVIRYVFNILGIKNPTYLDIGANHPYKLNNTMKFYLEGAKGINVEPNIALYNELLRARPRDLNLNVGISDTDGVAEFFVMDDPNLSTFSKSEAEMLEENNYSRIAQRISVETISIVSLLKKYANSTFPDFLNLDTEGYDEIILKSIQFDTGFPKVICVETISYSQKGTGVKRDSIFELLKDKGYFVYADTYINTIFIHQNTWSEHFLNNAKK